MVAAIGAVVEVKGHKPPAWDGRRGKWRFGSHARAKNKEDSKSKYKYTFILSYQTNDLHLPDRHSVCKRKGGVQKCSCTVKNENAFLLCRRKWTHAFLYRRAVTVAREDLHGKRV